jgi:hypothetical protein
MNISDVKIVFQSALILITLSLFSCEGPKPSIDLNQISVDWKFVPFHEVQHAKQKDAHLIDDAIKGYPQFGKLFFSTVIPLVDLSPEQQKEILEDPGFLSLVDTCMIIFEDVVNLKNEFDTAFKYYKYHTSDESVPNVYTFVSGFAYQNFIFSDENRDGLGIGLDMFMGSQFPYKSLDPKNPTFSQFLTQYFDKKYILRKSLLSWLDDKIPSTQTGQLAEIIIRNGKIFYLLEKLLPDSSKDIILEFQTHEYEWCLQNEPELWTYLLKNNLIYSNEFSKINKLVNPSPSVPGIPQEAPGGVANYIGWRIVQDYAVRKKVTINELIQEKDFQKILDESKYRPRVRK